MKPPASLERFCAHNEPLGLRQRELPKELEAIRPLGGVILAASPLGLAPADSPAGAV